MVEQITRSIVGQRIKQKQIAEKYTISKIAVKVALSPNQLIELYKLPGEMGTVDTESMNTDFNNGKGVIKIQEKQREFDSKEQDKCFVERLNLIENARPETFVEMVQRRFEDSNSKGGDREL